MRIQRIILAALLASTAPLAVTFSAALAAPPAAAPAVHDDRIPEPSEDKQAESLKVIRDIYKDDYAKRAPEDRRLLAGKLLEEGKKAQAEPANQYILLREARDVSISGGDIDLAVQASKELGEYFAVNSFDTLNKTLAAIRTNLKATDTQMFAFAAAQENAINAADKGQFEDATRAADLAITFASAAKNIQKAGEAQGLKTALVAQSKAYDDYTLGQETLKKSKNIMALADARQCVGLYMALYQKQWTEGCKLIAKGNSDDWAPVAENDLKNPSKTEDMIAVADGWWDLSNKESGHRYHLLERAQYWYNLALPGAEGVAKAKVEKRLETIAQAMPAYMGGADQATKSVLPTVLELSKLKDACRLFKNGDASQQAAIITQFNMLDGRLDAGIMDAKPADFAARLKADIDMRKMMEENGAAGLANGKQPLYNHMMPYAVASKSKEDLAERLIGLEKLNADTGFMNADKNARDRFDGLLYAALRTYVQNNSLVYNGGPTIVALADFLKQKGVKSTAVDRMKQTLGRQPPVLGTPPAKPPTKPAGR